MKNLVLLLMMSVMVLACKKESEEQPDGETGNFTITGVRDADLTMNSTASFAFPISVVPGAGTPENVSLRMDDLPGGVFAGFTPSSGTPPFNAQVNIWNDFRGAGGTLPVKLVGTAASGIRSYKMNVTVDHYRGWKFGDSVYNQKELFKFAGTPTRYPYVRVLGGGAGELTIAFSAGKGLPNATRSYKITSSSGVTDDIQLTMIDGPVSYSATGAGAPTGTFTFDSLGRFVFKCSNVEMSNGLDKKLLSVSVSE